MFHLSRSLLDSPCHRDMALEVVEHMDRVDKLLDLEDSRLVEVERKVAHMEISEVE